MIINPFAVVYNVNDIFFKRLLQGRNKNRSEQNLYPYETL